MDLGPSVPGDVGIDGGGPATDAAPSRSDAAVDATINSDAATAMDGAVVEVDAGLPPCEPALTMDPESGFSPAYDLVAFTPAGGTGQYRFELSDNQSGALVNELSGVYLAGPTEGVTDTVRLTDLGCIGEVTAQVFVVLPLELRPSTVRVIPGTELRFETFGGSGTFEYSPVFITSTGMISAEGVYAAGLELGQDIIKVRDVLTGLEAEAFVDVVASESLVTDPVRLFTTPGDIVPVSVEGGSGYVNALIDESIARFDPDTRILEAIGPGRTTLGLTDRYTGIATEITVDVAATLGAEMLLSGRTLNHSAIRATGDLDGDGFADAVIGFPDTNVDAFSDGAVMVYAGSEEGLGTTPVQILGGGRGRDAQAGRGLAVGDFDGDGQTDLAIGILNDDEVGGNAGAVHIHAGVLDGFFADEPTLRLFPVRGGDQLGFHVEACDFNGDGFMDLAANAQRYEDRENMPSNADVGAIFLYLGGPEGLSEAHQDPILVLELGDDGEFTFVPQMRTGEAMAAGDYDGDGHCDLAISRVGWPTAENFSRGAVFIYAGNAPVDDPEYPDPGGLDPLPARVITGVDGQGNGGAGFGRRLAAGDLDGDGRDELLVASHAFDLDGNDRGAVDIFAGGPLEGPVRAYTSASEADFTLTGTDPGDQFGIAVSVSDWNDDGVDDVVVGAWYDEIVGEEIPTNTGTLSVFPGVMGAWPNAEPAFIVAGYERNSAYGESAAHVGDVDGDGIGDFVAMIPRDNTFGARAGRAEYISGDGERRGWLDLPSNPSGAQFGRSAAFGDVTGDGISDLVVGAPEVGLPPDLVRIGQVFVYAGTDDGFETQPSLVFSEFTGHTVDDRFGVGAAVGDFNGDGRPDLAIAAQSDERGNVWEEGTFVEVGNCENRNNSGSVAVFLGGPEGVAVGTPDFVIYGPRRDSNINRLAMADVNGDGRDDVILGANFDDTGGRDRGRVQVVFGRLADADGRTTLACDAAFDLTGQGNRENLGFVDSLGDLDGDGCDDFAAGAPLADHAGDSDRGLLRVIFGWGGAACPATPMMLVFGGAGRSDQLGRGAIAGNFLGDERPELVISAPNAVQEGTNVRTGAAYVISGERIAGLQKQPAAAGERRIDLVGGETDVVIYGEFNGQQFGTEVGVVEGHLAVAITRERAGEARQIGGLHLFRFDADVPERVAQMVIETARFEGRMGGTLETDPSRPFIAVGGHLGAATGPENGAVYYFHLSDL